MQVRLIDEGGRRLRTPSLSLFEQVGGHVGGIEGRNAVSGGERAVRHVVEERIVLHRDAHGFAVGHGDLDVHATGGLHLVGDERIDERCAGFTFNHVLERCIEDDCAVEFDDDVAGLGDVATIPR